MFNTQDDSLLPVPSGSFWISEISYRTRQPNSGYKRPEGSVRLSLVIPASDTRKLQKQIEGLTSTLNQVLPHDYELIVVSASTIDRSEELAQTLSESLRVMDCQQESGMTAVIRGWQAARGEVLGVMDNVQYPPEVLCKLLEEIDLGADLAVASSQNRETEMSIRHSKCSLAPSPINKVGCISDPLSGYFLLRRHTIAERLISPLSSQLLIEILQHAAIEQVAEVGYTLQLEEADRSSKHPLWRSSAKQWGQLRRCFDFSIAQFRRFGAVGISGLTVDMSLLYMLHDLAGMEVSRSAILSAELAVINNFFWNDRWTLRASTKQRGSFKTIRRLLKFNLLCLMSVILKVLLLNLLMRWLHINVYLGNLLAIAIATFWHLALLNLGMILHGKPPASPKSSHR